MSNTPSDTELIDAYDSAPAHGNAQDVHVAGLRAVLAKWGTPQPAPAPLSNDTKRLDWMDKDNGKRVVHLVNKWYTRPSYGQPYRKHASLRDAIDAALAAQQQ